MRVKMLVELPGDVLLPGERFQKGQEYDVPDAVGSKWVRRMLAESVAAIGLAVSDKYGAAQDTPKRAPRRAGRETKEE